MIVSCLCLKVFLDDPFSNKMCASVVFSAGRVSAGVFFSRGQVGKKSSNHSNLPRQCLIKRWRFSPPSSPLSDGLSRMVDAFHSLTEGADGLVNPRPPAPLLKDPVDFDHVELSSSVGDEDKDDDVTYPIWFAAADHPSSLATCLNPRQCFLVENPGRVCHHAVETASRRVLRSVTKCWLLEIAPETNGA